MVNVFDKQSREFQGRHIGPDNREARQMLDAVGVSDIDDLIARTVPGAIRMGKPLQLPAPLSEAQLLTELKNKSLQNKVVRNYIGQGYYDTLTPSVIQRNILENPGWYTQYTPYQAEISQGRLESLLNFQTMVSDLTGLPIANASLLDEATAAAEAMSLMFHHVNRTDIIKAPRFFVEGKVLPQTIDVVLTRAKPLGIEIVIGDFAKAGIDDTYFGALLQYPDAEGRVSDYRAFIAGVHGVGGFVAMATDLLALTLLASPGELDADIALGSSQRFGVPLGYGGPHAAFFATKDDFKRGIPGRIIGVSIDAQGNRALRMALQTREQHIKREKATSNICTAQALLANMAAMYAVYHGPQGLKDIATRVTILAHTLANGLRKGGVKVSHEVFFDTLTIQVADREAVRAKALQAKMNFHYPADGSIGIALDETTTPEDVQDILSVFGGASTTMSEPAFPAYAVRHTAYLTHPVFNTHRSESQMMRYIKQLENKDLSLNTSMISLGSCTMKLNAATEMIPLSWAHWSKMHPFAPLDQVQGYAQIVRELSDYLCEITGFAACSLQPNSGAQGEYAGLLTIRAYLDAQGQTQRDVLLIPISAHGTNPASAVMAGFKVVVVKALENGYIDVDDLRAKATQYTDRLGGIMITYPSTYGIFEESVKDICAIVHEHGGQVYMDGANMNAQVGLTSPGLIGADVCHLNLHKTFAIPHGGGGPGMGPICVAAHLAGHLPGHVFLKGDKGPDGAVSAAPYGSASILLISYAYIRMLGAEGLTNATRFAILNANYMKARLEKDYDILYTGSNGTCAHEFIVDLRPFKAGAGIEAEDIAKRLMDYGFHAPTMSFPVPGTIMIEPTESEDKAELDRFCDAMLSIRREIEAVETGKADKVNNALKNAPHTQAVVISDAWDKPYSREQAAFPLDYVRLNKFWPSVGRINNTFGDRNLVCTCEPVESYAEAVV
ncbi:aminomethyl-transferring glycine dehydrogenase [Dinghuibacter silviterrae]|uniref:Glycine dehydrogenase (decarboxylating) n=1 Tax=Dinghuibacter silviterrae TaxID=1539049 RepID=A0A4R8DTI8_9BACT|nr:aminomethyl-transferring glycine dehydrogenase [Dinghuibacter silviterrae]TDX00745.1 glycine dehydrogenase (decarboxylating) alpha subunit /glycine dehydrogenase (decarboxylating) beta subunit [Dinghuibacter silviterrae]